MKYIAKVSEIYKKTKYNSCLECCANGCCNDLIKGELFRQTGRDCIENKIIYVREIDK